MTRYLSILSFALILVLSPIVSLGQEAEFAELTIESSNGPLHFRVERAVTPDQMARGLMFRRQMPQDQGMIFDHGLERMANMWMRNTYIPLDMIFIGGDGTIRHIAERTTPLSERTISSRSKVRYVLEINGGLSDELGIAIGHKVLGPALEGGK